MTADVIDLLVQRRSVRAFTDTPVPRDTLARICTAARMAPSGANLQPGKFHVLTGDALAELTSRLSRAIAEAAPIESEYSYFPPDMSPALKNRGATWRHGAPILTTTTGSLTPPSGLW